MYAELNLSHCPRLPFSTLIPRGIPVTLSRPSVVFSDAKDPMFNRPKLVVFWRENLFQILA